jgi:GntR family transcriptional regulator, arabinose operon transcriptional repressor
MSKSPIRQALGELSAEGYIYTVQGSGSYVTDLSSSLSRAPRTIHVLFYTNADIEQEIMLGMHARLRQQRDPSIRLSFQHPGEDTEALIRRLRDFKRDSPEALVLIPVLSRSRESNRRLASALRTLQFSGWCVIQVDHTVPDFQGAAIMTDHRVGAHMLTQHLLRLGHERIAVLLNHPERSSIAERLDGVRTALGLHGLTLSDAAVMEYEEADIRTRGSDLILRLDELRASAVISFENEGAAALLGEIEAAGRSVPEDLSLATFDNRAFERTHSKFITHILQPLYCIGERVMDLTLRSLERGLGDSSHPVESERLAPQLVLGYSCARYSTAKSSFVNANVES